MKLDLSASIIGTWLVKSCSKKLNDSYPYNEYIAIKLADLIPSLKNLRAIPGATFGTEASGAAAAEILIKPF